MIAIERWAFADRARDMTHWRIEVMGGERVPVGDGTPNDAAWLILGCLLAHDHHRLRRVELANELWPETHTDAALHRLASALWRIRKGPEPFAGLFQSSGEFIFLSLKRDVWIDALAFEHRAQRCLDANAGLADAAQRRRLRTALGRYAELLPLREGELIAVERERLRALYLDAAFALATVSSHHSEWPAVRAICEGLCAVEPLREDAQRLLIEAYLACGNRALALRQFHSFAEYLRRELQVEPMAETCALVTKISGATTPSAFFGATTDEPASLETMLLTARSQVTAALQVIDSALRAI